MRDLKPLNVSPVIKTTRWSLLFLGYIYGIRKKHKFELIEVNASVERHKIIEERVKNRVMENERKTRSDIRNLYAIFDVTDIPPEFKEI